MTSEHLSDRLFFGVSVLFLRGCRLRDNRLVVVDVSDEWNVDARGVDNVHDLDADA